MFVFILNIIIYRCKDGYFGTTACTACKVGCGTCTVDTTCTACDKDANRVTFTSTATNCLYLF